MTKLLVDLRNFANALKKCNIVSMHVSIKVFPRRLVGLLSVFCHPKQMSCTTVLRSFAGYEPWSKYYTCWSWTKTDMTFCIMKGRRLIVDENGCALEYVRCCSPIFYEHTAEHTEYFYGTPCSSSRRDQMACNYQGAAQPLHASCLFRSFFSFRHNLLQEAGLQEDHSLEQRNETFRNLILQQHLHI
jgi:hypothetical protein